MLLYLTGTSPLHVTPVARQLQVLAIATSVADANAACGAEHSTLAVAHVYRHNEGELILLADRDDQGEDVARIRTALERLVERHDSDCLTSEEWDAARRALGKRKAGRR